jgi:hypothetical protein
MEIKAIYDNGGETLDRYTVYFTMKDYNGFYECLVMNEQPFHGIGMHCTGQLGPHNGKLIQFSELPTHCQKAVHQELNFPQLIIELSA